MSSLIGHNSRRNAQAPAEIGGDIGQGLARAQSSRSLDMRSQISIPEGKPGLAAQSCQRGHEVPRFVAPAPPALRVIESGKGIHDRVEIGRDRKPEMLEVVRSVDDDDKIFRPQDATEPKHELGPTDPT